MRRARWLGLGSVTGILAACFAACQPEQGCQGDAGGLPFEVLEFRHVDDDSLIDSKLAARENNTTYDTTQLALELQTPPLLNRMVLRGPTDHPFPFKTYPGRMEADAYVEDPYVHTTLQTFNVGYELASNTTLLWPTLTRRATVMALPYPQRHATTQNPDFPESTSTVLSSNDFFSGAAAPPGTTLTNAIIYDRGACARAQPYAPLLRSQLRGAMAKLFCAGQDVDAIVQDYVLRWARAESYLDHAPGDPQDLRGGVFISVNALIDINPFVPVADVLAQLGLRLEFGLDDRGFVTVEPTTLYEAVQPSGSPFDFILGPIVTEIILSTLDPIDPAAGLSSIRRLQTQPIPAMASVPPVYQPCRPPKLPSDPGLDVQCASAMTLLNSILVSGDLAVGAGSETGRVLTDEELGHSQEYVLDPTHWACEPELGLYPAPLPAIPVCQFIVPVKRLNPFPDRMEAVFFDGVEPETGGFIAWLALKGLETFDPDDARTALRQMCNAGESPTQDPTSDIDPAFRRSFASVELPACDECEATNDITADFCYCVDQAGFTDCDPLFHFLE